QGLAAVTGGLLPNELPVAAEDLHLDLRLLPLAVGRDGDRLQRDGLAHLRETLDVPLADAGVERCRVDVELGAVGDALAVHVGHPGRQRDAPGPPAPGT